jgi:hypothetical protein
MHRFWTALALVFVLPQIASAANFVETTVTRDIPAQTYNFQVSWDSPPDFTVDSFGRAADQARFLVMTGATTDYSLFLPGITDNTDHQVSIYDGFISSLIGTRPYAVSGDIVDFSVPFTLLNEPADWYYTFETYHYGVWDGTTYVGSPNGLPAQVVGVPELSTWAMLLIGFSWTGIVTYRSRQKKNSAGALVKDS